MMCATLQHEVDELKQQRDALLDDLEVCREECLEEVAAEHSQTMAIQDDCDARVQSILADSTSRLGALEQAMAELQQQAADAVAAAKAEGDKAKSHADEFRRVYRREAAERAKLDEEVHKLISMIDFCDRGRKAAKGRCTQLAAKVQLLEDQLRCEMPRASRQPITPPIPPSHPPTPLPQPTHPPPGIRNSPGFIKGSISAAVGQMRQNLAAQREQQAQQRAQQTDDHAPPQTGADRSADPLGRGSQGGGNLAGPANEFPGTEVQQRVDIVRPPPPPLVERPPSSPCHRHHMDTSASGPAPRQGADQAHLFDRMLSPGELEEEERDYQQRRLAE